MTTWAELEEAVAHELFVSGANWYGRITADLSEYDARELARVSISKIRELRLTAVLDDDS